MPLLKAGVVSVAATGQLVWALGSTGSKEVIDDNSAEIEMLAYNSELAAQIVTAGGNPLTTHYPQLRVFLAGVIAGGGGGFPEATWIAALTGKVFIEEVIINLHTDTASGGVEIFLRDGTGGAVLHRQSANIYQPHTKERPGVAGTAATLVSVQGQVSDFATLADNDSVWVTIKYREI